MTRIYNNGDSTSPVNGVKQKMSYQQASGLRKKSLSDLLLQNLLDPQQTVGGAFKKTISDKTTATIKGIKQRFDPMNIVKTLTFGSNLMPALYGRLRGRSLEDMKFFSGDSKAREIGSKPTKVDKISETDEGLITVLSQIYSLLKKSHEDEVQKRELENNLSEEKQLEAEKRHKELLDALSKITGGGGDVNYVVDPSEPDKSVGDVVADVLGAFGGLKAIVDVGKWFAGPAGLTLLGIGGAAALGGYLGMKFQDWKLDKSKTIGGSKAEEALKKMNAIDDADSEAYKQAEKEYNEAIKEKQEFVRIFLEKNGYKTYLKRNFFGKETGEYYYEDAKGKAPKSEDMKLASEYADEQIAAGVKLQMPGSEPAPSTAASNAPAPTTPAPTPQSPAPTAAPKAEPAPSTPTSSKVNESVATNQELKLQEKTQNIPSETVNNNKTVNTSQQKQVKQTPIPPVRNQERSFQKMLWDSTRIV